MPAPRRSSCSWHIPRVSRLPTVFVTGWRDSVGILQHQRLTLSPLSTDVQLTASGRTGAAALQRAPEERPEERQVPVIRRLFLLDHLAQQRKIRGTPPCPFSSWPL